MNATALVVTFEMNNFIQNETFIKIAMAWEAKFIELIKNYTSDNIDIAFMAEVC